jgi:flagellar biosynthesis protein FliP
MNRAAILLALFALVLMATTAVAQDETSSVDDIFDTARSAIQPQNISTTLWVFILLTGLTLAPAALVMTTSFTRIIVVLGFLRQAMATQQSPPNQILIGLALFLSVFIMTPTYTRVYDEAIQPYIEGEITDPREAYDRAEAPIREFMFRQVGPKDLALFVRIAGIKREDIRTPDDVPTHVLIPGFMISEMRIAFTIGFLIYIPFLIIDMVVASTLMAMGMMMLPPVFVSLPFKIIMFVLADGWYLLIGELVESFR